MDTVPRLVCFYFSTNIIVALMDISTKEETQYTAIARHQIPHSLPTREPTLSCILSMVLGVLSFLLYVSPRGQTLHIYNFQWLKVPSDKFCNFFMRLPWDIRRVSGLGWGGGHQE